MRFSCILFKNFSYRVNFTIYEAVRAIHNGEHDIKFVENEENETENPYQEESAKCLTYKKSKLISASMKAYLNSKLCLKAVSKAIPECILIKKKTIPESEYIIDKDIAYAVAETIKPYVSDCNRTLIEINPGLGILTQQLLKINVPQIIQYESNIEFLSELEKLRSRFPNRIVLTLGNFISLPKLEYRDKLDDFGRVEKFLEFYPKGNWENDPCATVVGVMSSLKFFNYLNESFVFHHGLMSKGRSEFFFLIPPSLHLVLTCSGEDGYSLYKPLTVLFQILFEIEVILKVPKQGILPWYSSKFKGKGKEQIKSLDNEFSYFVRIVPLKDCYEKVCSSEEMPQLWYFIKQLVSKRKNRVIPMLESWIPGCGTRLIKEGYNIFTEFGEINPPEILKLFKLFRNWPEFSASPFLSSMESNFIKTEQEMLERHEGGGKGDKL